MENKKLKGGGGVAGAKSYNSRSGAIFGILTAMKDEFDKNLKNAISEEEAAAKAFAEMNAAKTKEINAAKKGVDEKTAELADTQDKNAQAKEDLEATQKAMEADEEFLVDLKEKCETAAQEYSVRAKTRSEEVRAIGETIGILTEDDARELAGKTQGTIFFLQEIWFCHSSGISRSVGPVLSSPRFPHLAPAPARAPPRRRATRPRAPLAVHPARPRRVA